MRYPLLLSALCCLPVLSVAQKALYQPGYIVRASAPADTVRGYINTFYAVRKKGTISFISTLDSARHARTLRPVDLSAAGVGTQEAYVVRPLPIQGTLQPRFLQTIVLGKASLYKTDANEQSATYFIEQDPVQLMPLRRGQYTQVLRLVLTDCAELTFKDKEVNTTYSRAAFQNTVVRYNQCTVPGATSRVLQGPPRPRVRLGLRAGLQHSRMYYPDAQDGFSPKATWQPAGGLFVQFPITAGFSILPEIAYGKTESADSRVGLVDASTDVRRLEIKLDASYVLIPVTGRYTFRQPKRTFRPYLEAGYIWGRALSANSYRVQTFISSANPYSSTAVYPVDKVVGGFHGGAGVEFLSKVGVWGITGRIERISLNTRNLSNFIYLDNNQLTFSYAWH